MLTNNSDGQWIWGKKCPTCKSTARIRVRRESWMRLYPCSKHYLCVHCRGKYLIIMECVSLQKRQPCSRKSALLMSSEPQ